MPPRKLHVALIVNPRSGSCDPDAIVGWLRAAGARVSTFTIGNEAKAVAANPDRLVVAGGDGSIALAAIAARDSGLPLGIIPAGTANDFARAVGLPLDHETACWLAVTGTVTSAWDIAWVDDHPFLNTAAIGLPVDAAERSKPLKRKLGPLAYSAGAAVAALLDKPIHCSVQIDGHKEFEGMAWQISMSNTGSFGGGAQLTADLHDHELDIWIVPASPKIPFNALSRMPIVGHAPSRSLLPLHAAGMKLGGRRLHPLALHRQGSDIRIRSDIPLDWNLDGDLQHAGKLARINIQPDVFDVVVT